MRQHIPEGILQYLYSHQDWRMVYFDYDAVIFLKNISEYEDIIKEFHVDLKNWEPPKMNLFKLGAANVIPFQHYYRAYTWKL